MFARVLEFHVKREKKTDFIQVHKARILPVLRREIGFLEILPLIPVNMEEGKVLILTLWANQTDAENYDKEIFPLIADLLKPMLTAPIALKEYHLESSLCEQLVEALI